LIKVYIEEKKGIVIVFFYGELSSANFHDIEEDIKDAINRESDILALNLDGLENIDSTGIGFLVKVKTKFAGSKKKLILYSTPARILELLYIAQVDTLFEIISKKDFDKKYMDK
jgi:anti-anti-sigma factor